MSSAEPSTESVRPALVTLTRRDASEVRDELLTGFPSRTDLLTWLQRVTVRTLGRMRMDWYERMGDQFRTRRRPTTTVYELVPGEQRPHGLVVDLLLMPDVRCRELDDGTCQEFRERMAATYFPETTHHAFRTLRRDAGEYIDEGDEDSVHNPDEQEHIAMRPALNEIDEAQSAALDALVKGFDDREDILDWSETLELATHGELDESLVERCYKEDVTAQLLLDEPDSARKFRETMGATLLLPQFNAGVRDLVGRAGELPDAETVHHDAAEVA